MQSPMIRAVVAQSPDNTWHFYRQSQWIALIRRDISVASWPKLMIDISEENYLQLLQIKSFSDQADVNSMKTWLANLYELKIVDSFDGNSLG